MQIYKYEIDDGIADAIKTSASFSYASIAEPCSLKKPNITLSEKISASINDSDLYYVQSILVSSSWNKNDDIFDKLEVWAARKTPEDKPTNLEHDEGIIVGHITNNWPISDDGTTVFGDSTDPNTLPDKYHILTGSVIYRAFTGSDLKERAEKLIADIESGNKFVSMECFFKGFDYGLLNKTTGEYKVLSRNEATAYLTKYLRAYGGIGEHENYKIGRVLRNITFSGKGFVDKPANPDSIIFTKDIINKLFTEKNDDLLIAGVSNDQLPNNVENIDMNENQNNSTTSETEASVTSVQNLQAQITELQNQVAAQAETIKVLETEKEEAAKKMKDEEEKMKEEAAKKAKEDEEKMKEEAAKKEEEDKKEEDRKKLKAELEAALQTIADYQQKEEEMAKKEKKMQRKASLTSVGFDDASAEATVEKFDSLADDAFEAMTTLFAGKMPPWLNKDKKDKDEESDKKKKASVTESVTASVLDNVEVDTGVSVGAGTVETDPVGSVRSELIEFVCATLGKKLNKGE